ncbi:hypothetical protein [Paraflavitalea speifideaquila]|uniref:hypothetical protein n=1 Tax=Paraflavitalea speifideaquila TaxID=3076558 RepID=UPI0028F0C5BB|nr:hypothetical protein [Paraflavitalea speifideiaquila]
MYAGGGEQTQGQVTGVDKAVVALHKLAAKYHQPQWLSFDVQFRYAAETQPATWLDSLGGQYKLHGNRFWSILDDQVSINDGQLQLMVFAEDKLLMLARAGSNAGAGPVSMLDSFLVIQKEGNYQFTTTATEEVIEISFPGPGMYKKLAWHIDKQSGYLNKMVSVLPANQLYDPSVRALVNGGSDAYVIVETLYRHYQQGAFTEGVFNLGKYIKKKGRRMCRLHRMKTIKCFWEVGDCNR